MYKQIVSDSMKTMMLIGVVALMYLTSCTKENESIIVSSTDITESVYASGKVKATDQYIVYSTVSGVLQTIMVNLGDTVVKGQTLFELDNLTSKLNTDNARLALELSSKNNQNGSEKLQEMELNVNLASEKLYTDSIFYERQKWLLEQNSGTQFDFDQKKLAYNNSRISYQTAKNRLLQLKTQLSNELARASIAYNLNKKLTTDYSIRSVVNGKVYDVLKEKGELVTPQTPLAVIGKADAFYLELEVDENDITKIVTGQKAVVTMDSYKGKVLDALVDKIHPIMNERTRTFTIELHFVNPPKRLYPNLTAEANVIIQTKNNTITIPSNYVVDKKYVIVNKNEKREIKIGLTDYQKIEVLQGLAVNDKIYKP